MRFADFGGDVYFFIELKSHAAYDWINRLTIPYGSPYARIPGEARHTELIRAFRPSAGTLFSSPWRVQLLSQFSC